MEHITHPFSIREVIGQTWELTRKHFGFLIVAGLTYAGLNYVFNAPMHIASAQRAAHGISYGFVAFECFAVILALIGCFVLLAVQGGFIRCGLNMIRGTEPRFGDLFSQFSKGWRIIGACFLLVLIVLVGCVLLIVPGIVYGLKFSQCLYLVVDKNLGVIESLKQSEVLTKGAKWKLFFLFLAVFSTLGLLSWLITLADLPIFSVGLYVAMPWTVLICAVVYERLRLRAEPLGGLT